MDYITGLSIIKINTQRTATSVPNWFDLSNEGEDLGSNPLLVR